MSSQEGAIQQHDLRRASDTSAVSRGYDSSHKRFASLPTSLPPSSIHSHHQQHRHIGGHVPIRHQNLHPNFHLNHPQNHLQNRHPPSQQLQQAKHRLEHAFVRDRLSQKLERRPNVETLLRHNILKAEHIAPSLMRTQRQLQHNMAANRLGEFLEKRIDIDELEQHNIAQDMKRVAPSIQGKQRRLKRNLAKSNLYHALKHRPTRQSLEAHGILPILFTDDRDDPSAYYFYNSDLRLEKELPPPQNHEPHHEHEGYTTRVHAHSYSSSAPPSTTPTPTTPTTTNTQPSGLPKPRSNSQPPTSFIPHPREPPQEAPRDLPQPFPNRYDPMYEPDPLFNYYDQQPPPAAPLNLQPQTPQHSQSPPPLYYGRNYIRRSQNFMLIRLLLKFVANLSNNGDITQEQKGLLKNMIVDQDPTVLAAAEVYELDSDIEEFKDTLSRMVRPDRQQYRQPRTNEYDFDRNI